ncbi:MAG: hypothetical protein SPI35_00410 [Porphyromonas sp.]|nr:hypothetical protein [Porphyromonas sp.]
MKKTYFIALCTFVLGLLFASNSFAQDSSTEYRVTFNVYAIHSSRGSIEAFVDGKEIKSKDKVPAGTKVTFKAKPNGGYEVDKWTVRPQQEGLSLKNESTWTIEVKSNITVELRYKTAEGIFHKVNFAVADGQDAQGTVTAFSGEDKIENGASLKENSPVKFVIAPKEGFEVDKVLVNEKEVVLKDGEVAGEKVYQIEKLNEAITLKASFKAAAQVNKYKVTFTTTAGEGTVTAFSNYASADKAEVKSGDSLAENTPVEFVFTPKEGSEVDKVLVNAEEVTLENGATAGQKVYRVEKLAGNVALLVSFKTAQASEKYTVAFSVYHLHASRGTISATANGEPITSKSKIAAGSKIVFTAKPNEGYVVDKWDGVKGVEGVTVSEDKLICTVEKLSQVLNVYVRFVTAPVVNKVPVTFAAKKDTEAFGSVVAKVGGKEIKSGDEVEVGSTITFEAKVKDAEYDHIKGWTKNGAAWEAEGKEVRTIKVEAALNVEVEFYSTRSVAHVAQNNVAVFIDGAGNLVIQGLQHPSDISVYALTGELMKKGFGTSVNVSELPQSIYLVKVGNKVYKVRK